MNELIDWLRAQLDEDEGSRLDVHTSACGSGIYDGSEPCECRWPGFVLDDIAAKRLILGEHFESSLPDGIMTGECTTCFNYSWPCPTVRLLALPYADRPGYREEWRP